MDHPVSRRVRAAERSKIRVMYDLAEDHDGDLVRLEVGEPDFDTPDHIVDAAAEAARAGDTHYTPNAGTVECREAIADRLAADRDLSVDPDGEVCVTNGGMEALHLAVLSIVDPGEEVVVPTPAWPNYAMQTILADGDAVEVPLPADEGFALDAERVADAVGPDTAAVVLTRPSNPTGRVYGRDDLRRVVEAAAAHDAYVVADEVYADLSYVGDLDAVASFVDHPERVLTVGSVSKAYAMTGWRLGWLAGPEPVVSQATKIHESTSACAGSVSQAAATAALEGPREPVERMRSAFRRRRDLVVDRIGGMPAVSCPDPEGAFYAFLDVGAAEGDSLSVAKRLLEEYGVVTAPGGGFGEAGEGYLRLSFANSMDRLETGLDRIEDWVREEVA